MNNLHDILLVDLADTIIGYGEKLPTHQKGMLHRAFSVLLFDNTNQLMLLQKRASRKYHSGGLWTNACCGHPFDKKSIEWYAKKRLYEEMGVYCELVPQFKFIYHAKLDKGLVEHEIDHVLCGYYDDDPSPNLSEAEDFIWIDQKRLYHEIRLFPDRFTVWFKYIIKHYINNNISWGIQPTIKHANHNDQFFKSIL